MTNLIASRVVSHPLPRGRPRTETTTTHVEVWFWKRSKGHGALKSECVLNVVRKLLRTRGFGQEDADVMREQINRVLDI